MSYFHWPQSKMHSCALVRGGVSRPQNASLVAIISNEIVLPIIISAQVLNQQGSANPGAQPGGLKINCS